VKETQDVAPDDDLVTVSEDPPLDPLAVDEHAVEAAVVEHADAVGLAHDERVAARDGRIVEADVGGKAPADPRPLARQRDDSQVIALAEGDVLAGLGDARARLGHPGAGGGVGRRGGRGRHGQARVAEQRRACEALAAAARARRQAILRGERHRVVAVQAPERTGPRKRAGIQRVHFFRSPSKETGAHGPPVSLVMIATRSIPKRRMRNVSFTRQEADAQGRKTSS
jgi:hypothetical protein